MLYDSASFSMEESGEAAYVRIRIATAISQIRQTKHADTTTDPRNDVHHVVRRSCLQRHDGVQTWSISVPDTAHYRVQHKHTH